MQKAPVELGQKDSQPQSEYAKPKPDTVQQGVESQTSHWFWQALSPSERDIVIISTCLKVLLFPA